MKQKKGCQEDSPPGFKKLLIINRYIQLTISSAQKAFSMVPVMKHMLSEKVSDGTENCA